MKMILVINGVLLIVLALVHVFFPKRFNWKTDMAKVSLLNRQIMYVHTFFIALTVCMMGLLCLIATEELATTKLGNIIMIGFGFFWAVRLVFQFFVYSSKLWRGKRFETIIHIVFILLWAYLSASFLWIGGLF